MSLDSVSLWSAWINMVRERGTINWSGLTFPRFIKRKMPDKVSYLFIFFNTITTYFLGKQSWPKNAGTMSLYFIISRDRALETFSWGLNLRDEVNNLIAFLGPDTWDTSLLLRTSVNRSWGLGGYVWKIRNGCNIIASKSLFWVPGPLCSLFKAILKFSPESIGTINTVVFVNKMLIVWQISSLLITN